MTILEEARKMRTIIEQAAQSLDDTTALEGTALYPKWEVGVAYTAGLRVSYDAALYKVLQDHISQSDWTPIAAPSLFAKVLIPDENVIPAWEQPDSTNPYMIGDKVSHNGKTWASTCDNNVWEPGAYGWNEVTE